MVLGTNHLLDWKRYGQTNPVQQQSLLSLGSTYVYALHDSLADHPRVNCMLKLNQFIAIHKSFLLVAHLTRTATCWIFTNGSLDYLHGHDLQARKWKVNYFFCHDISFPREWEWTWTNAWLVCDIECLVDFCSQRLIWVALPLPGTRLKVFWATRVIYDIGYQDISSQCTRVRLLFYNNI